MTHPRILMFADTLDRTHDVMGFLPSWVRALETAGAHVSVIAQHVRRDETASVVLDLDKVRARSRFVRLWRTWAALIRLRASYDDVFVVMAPTWALLIAPLARMMGKRVFLWYAVWRGSWKLRVAEAAVNGIFCSVLSAFPFRSRKVHAVGQAIDTGAFTPHASRRRGEVLFVGRISPVKHIELLIDALREDRVRDAGLKVVIAGAPVSAGDHGYEAAIRSSVHRNGLEDTVEWLGRVGHDATGELFGSCDIAVNMTPAGSFDKTMLEAMSCGAIIVASNPALREFLPSDVAQRLLFREGDPSDLARVLSDVVGMPDADKERLRSVLREAVVRYHSLDRWAQNIIANLE